MKSLFSAFAFLLLPYAAHAQAIINMPQNLPETAEVTYTGFENAALAGGHFVASIKTLDGQDYGILMCVNAKMKARIETDGEIKAGYFAFDDSAKCDAVAAAMQEKPLRHVKFTFETDPAKRDAIPGYEGGRITRIEWLSEGSN